ncbi:S-layer homology domain-containing protein [Biomaibacter acetigenes]|uniref:S-layer homology domain-containing protein n=1 Tax=Biomaibacter acetigenes TaxID=2316383 RepID=UPI0013CED206|nr:S-layer homology domain-containing protein [Biomaibacter acetigenes]
MRKVILKTLVLSIALILLTIPALAAPPTGSTVISNQLQGTIVVNPASSGGGGGGAGGGGTPKPGEQPPAPPTGGSRVISDIDMKVEARDGTAIVTVSDEGIEKVLRQGATNAVIQLKDIEGIQAKVSVGTASIEKLAEKGGSITVESPWAQITVDAGAINTKGAGENARVSINVKQVEQQEVAQVLEKLPENLKPVGNIVDVTVAVENTAQTAFTKRIRLVVAARVEESGNYFVYRINDDGTLECVGGEIVKDAGGNVIGLSADLNHLSKYAVMKFESKFMDISGHWAKKDILFMEARGIARGTEESKFSPQASITRAQFAALLVRSLGIQEYRPQEATFKDVKPGDWSFGAIEAAYKAGIVSGIAAGNFAPDKNITRQEMAVMMVRAMEYKNKTLNVADSDIGRLLGSFADKSSIAAWADKAVAACIGEGIMQGRTTTAFAPNENATRAENVIVLKRLLMNLGLI